MNTSITKTMKMPTLKRMDQLVEDIILAASTFSVPIYQCPTNNLH